MNCITLDLSKNGRFAGALIICLFLGIFASPAFAAEFEFKGTKFNVGGAVKLSAMYDIDGNINDSKYNGMGELTSAYSAPLDGTAQASEDHFTMSARESRIWAKTATQTDIGVFSSILEGDYNSDNNYSSDTWSASRSFRLRHAAITLTSGKNSVLFGQTWTNFMDFAGAVPVMDLAGDPGQPFVRQSQVRFTHNFDKGHYVAISAENSDRGMTAGSNGALIATPGESTETMPDVIVKYFWGNRFFHLSPKAMIRRFELDGKSTEAYALSLTSHIGIGKGSKITAGVTYGDGVGRYGALGLNGGAGISSSGDIETIEFISFTTGFTLALRDDLAWTVGCGYSENDEDAYETGVLTGNANKDAFAWHTMLAWKMTPAFECALGFTSMEQTVMDGREGDMMKVQSYVRYTF